VPYYDIVKFPGTVKLATLHPPAGAGNVVTVFVPGLAEIEADPGALTKTTPDPPAPEPEPTKFPLESSPRPPPPLPVFTVPAVETLPFTPPFPPILEPPAPGVPEPPKL